MCVCVRQHSKHQCFRSAALSWINIMPTRTQDTTHVETCKTKTTTKKRNYKCVRTTSERDTDKTTGELTHCAYIHTNNTHTHTYIPYTNMNKITDVQRNQRRKYIIYKCVWVLVRSVRVCVVCVCEFAWESGRPRTCDDNTGIIAMPQQPAATT